MVAALINVFIYALSLAILDDITERFANFWIKLLFRGLLGIVLAGWLIDFFLFKTMAIHISTALRLLLGNGWRQSILILEASGIRPSHFEFLFAILFAASGVCIGLMHFTWQLSAQRFKVCGIRILALIISLAAILIAWEISWRHDYLREKAWYELHRVMPFALHLMDHVSGQRLEVGRLRQLHSPKEVVDDFENLPQGKKELPDIFIFILESTRGDYVNDENTPLISGFARDCLSFRDTFSAANATHLSWFSLLTANYPLNFAINRNNHSSWGSVPLELLRKKGYTINVLAGTFLNYFDVDRVVFGADQNLLASLVDGRSFPNLSRPKRDEEVTRLLLQEIDKNRGGRVFLVFYDSTHHDYYWPEDQPPHFQPVAKDWKYFNFGIKSNELAMIKNRYRTALFFVDSLVGQTIAKLKDQGRYDQSLIVVTGDHGEEFLEHGKLVHASEIWREQIHVPILLKPPKSLKRRSSLDLSQTTASHVDILPTVLDLIGIDTKGMVDGLSLLRKGNDCSLVVADNGVRDPYRFCLIHNNKKAWFQYRSSSTLISLEQNIYLQALTDTYDRSNPEVGGFVEPRLKEFQEGLRHLFPSVNLNEFR